jgi:hypothetical protein
MIEERQQLLHSSESLEERLREEAAQNEAKHHDLERLQLEHNSQITEVTNQLKELGA